MIWHTLQTLFPVFAVIGLGYALSKKRFLSGRFLEELNKLVYWISLPALIVVNLDSAQSLAGGTLSMVVIYYSATIGIILIGYLVARLLKLEPWQQGTFVQGAFRGNLAFIGIPILVYALRDLDAETASSIIAKAVFVFAPIMILYNVAAVLVLTHGQDGGSGKLMTTLKKVGTNPLILAAVTGLLLYLLPVDLPGFASDTLRFIGRTAAPMALICVGGGMALTSMEGRYRSATYSALLKTVATPVLAYLISLPFNLGEMETLILMIFTATPTAVASYVMARQLNGDAPMASGAIILSTLLSVISLSVVVALF